MDRCPSPRLESTQSRRKDSRFDPRLIRLPPERSIARFEAVMNPLGLLRAIVPIRNVVAFTACAFTLTEALAQDRAAVSLPPPASRRIDFRSQNPSSHSNRRCRRCFPNRQRTSIASRWWMTAKSMRSATVPSSLPRSLRARTRQTPARRDVLLPGRAAAGARGGGPRDPGVPRRCLLGPERRPGAGRGATGAHERHGEGARWRAGSTLRSVAGSLSDAPSSAQRGRGHRRRQPSQRGGRRAGGAEQDWHAKAAEP